MVSCTDFLRDFSEYHDGYMGPAGRAAMEAHLAGCPACERYVRVYQAGVEQFRGLDPVEPSYDFVDRLQHRIYNLEEARLTRRRREFAGLSGAFLVMLLLAVGAAAWWPRQERLAVIELPPVVASEPKKPEVHALFRPGPLLTPSYETVQYSRPTANTLFLRYPPRGGNAVYPSYTRYPTEPLSRP